MRDELFEELEKSIKQMKGIMRGEMEPGRAFEFNDPDDPDVAKLREHYGLSQAQFAALLGISVGTLRGWEQGRRKPEGAARVLLRVAAKHPSAVLDANREMETANGKSKHSD